MSSFTLHAGDCREVMASMAPASVDAIITDPPYGTGSGASIYGRRREGRINRIANDTDLEALSGAAAHFARVLRPIGVGFVFHAPQHRRAVENLLEGAGLAVHGVIVWDKGAPGISYRIRYAHEDAVLFSLPGANPWAARPPIISPMRFSRISETVHPNQKPVDLLRALVEWACHEGGTVLDPFMGSGSCGVAALVAGRSYIGVEVDPQWVPVAESRLRAATGHNDELPLFTTEDDMSPKNEQDDAKVLEFIQTDAQSNGGTTKASLRRIAAATGVAAGTVWGCLQRLAAAGKIEEAGKDGRSKVWKLAA